MSFHCLEIPDLIDDYFNKHVNLPYSLKIAEIREAVLEIYGVLHDINRILLERSGSRLEDTILANSLSGIISELFVKTIADKSPNLIRNEKVGGHPDLLPAGYYNSSEVLHGNDGIEIKSSIQKGGWQGHNPEDTWIMVFRYQVDTVTLPIENRAPTRFVQVLIAELKKEDWSFSGRRGTSRRTPTASITRTGMHKLRSNPVYQEPEAIVNPGKYSFDALYGG
jgi:hypothetical protein